MSRARASRRRAARARSARRRAPGGATRCAGPPRTRRRCLSPDHAPSGASPCRTYRRAAIAVRDVPDEELRRLAKVGRLRDLQIVGEKTASIIAEALAGKAPEYLVGLEQDAVEPGTDAGNAIRRALRGDLHVHSDW